MGTYCHKCGEKKLDKKDFTIRKFIEQGIDIFTHYDSKIIKSIVLLISKPGFLTKEYLKGVRVRYAKPFQLFFLINIIYFFILNLVGYDIFTTTLDSFTDSPIYGSLVKTMVEDKIQKQNISYEKYADDFYNSIYVQSKLLIVIMIPMLAFCLKLIYWHQRKLFYEHLIYATYFFTLLLLFTTILNLNVELSIEDDLASVLITIPISIYLYIALKRLYQQSVRITIFKTILTVFGLILITGFYKFILFLTVYYTT